MAVGKAPAFQFYVRDWLSDPLLRRTQPTTKGIWIDLLCYMWESPERGQLEGTMGEFSRMTGATLNELDIFFADAARLKFCNVVTDDSKNITVVNRRMYRVEKERKSNANRQKKYRDNGKGNGKVTPPSSTASSTSKNNARSARLSDLKKLAGGSRDHTLCDKYGQECGIAGASYEELKAWASNQIRKMERETCG